MRNMSIVELSFCLIRSFIWIEDVIDDQSVSGWLNDLISTFNDNTPKDSFEVEEQQEIRYSRGAIMLDPS